MAENEALRLWASRLASRSALASEEIEAIFELPFEVKRLSLNQDVNKPGEPASGVHIVSYGLIGRYRRNGNGSRQIAAIYLPGDACNLPSLMLPGRSSSLVALNEADCVVVSRDSLERLASRSPAIAMALWRDCSVDHEVSMEWTFVLGGKMASSQLAHFLCELGCRFEQKGELRVSFPLYMSQETIGAVLGLTAVHVNRMLRQLKDAGFIATRDRRVSILNWQGLSSLAGFSEAYLHLRKG
jgi:CRP-like cAMP-binding protein